MWLKKLLLLILPLFLSSCGYELVTAKGIKRGELKSVYIASFRNATYEPHISGYVTDAFFSEISSLGLFEVNRPDSQAYLHGTVKKVDIGINAVDAKGIAVEKFLRLEVEVTLTEKTGKLLRSWNLSDTEIFRSDNPNTEDYEKREAARRAAQKIARRLSSLLLMEQ